MQLSPLRHWYGGAAPPLYSPAGHSVKTMAAEQARICPICCGVQKDVAYAIPCHHEFCLGCILQWDRQKESCLLCRRVMTVIKVAAWDDDDDLGFTIQLPAPSVPPCFQAGTAPMPFPLLFLLLPDEQEPEEAEEELMMSSLLPEVWAALFRQHWDPVLPWLHQELHIISGTQWWSAGAVENLILCDTELCGLPWETEQRLSARGSLMPLRASGVKKPTDSQAYRESACLEGRRTALWLPLALQPSHEQLSPQGS